MMKDSSYKREVRFLALWLSLESAVPHIVHKTCLLEGLKLHRRSTVLRGVLHTPRRNSCLQGSLAGIGDTSCCGLHEPKIIADCSTTLAETVSDGVP